MTTISDTLSSLAPVDKKDLVGQWHVIQTNFPMWLTGKKLAPKFNYSLVEGDVRVSDSVRFLTRAGKVKHIDGFDTQDPHNAAHFTWRGKGILGLLSSDWYILHLDQGTGVMAIYFTKTLFTPEGMDIVARDAQPNKASINAALTAVQRFAPLQGQLKSLKSL